MALLVVFLTYGAHTYLLHKDVQEVGLSMTVGDYVGFDTNTSALTFGTLPAGGQSTRYLNVSHDEPFDMHVSMAVEGNISDFIRVSGTEFILSEGESREVTVYASTGKEARKGRYEGTLYLYFKRVW